jgi:hypothetical protein
MKSFSPGVHAAIALAAITGVSLSAQAQVEEDSSAAFERANAELGAAMGLPAADSTVTTHANGMTSAHMGLEAMKMLVVRQNADGSYSYGHASSEGEAQEFMHSENTTQREEQ